MARRQPLLRPHRHDSNAITPYIHPGAFFLALKLRGGETSGDITPIVLTYASDLPMIPITLTQVSSVDNMGVLVWSVGEARAVPHNYYHVVLDDLPVWFSNFSTYTQQLIDAVHEAPGKHGFITQYAGTSAVARNVLVYPGRFGNLAVLRALTSPSAYLSFLRGNGYAFTGVLLSILSRYIPEPPALVAAGVPLAQFYANYDSYASGAATTPMAAPPRHRSIPTHSPTRSTRAWCSRRSPPTRSSRSIRI